MPAKPLPESAQRRAAELLGLGLTFREVAGALEIAKSSVEKIAKRPDLQHLRHPKTHESTIDQARAVVHEMLASDNAQLRRQAVEMLTKHPELAKEPETQESNLLPGVVLRYPQAK